MELAIPGVALGLLYIVSSQKSKSENFRNRSQLPNVNVPNTNYPDEYPVTSPDTQQTSELSTNNRYDNGGGTYTDKYFNPNVANTLLGAGASNNPQFYSLTGEKVDGSYFQHNNMVPFFGSNNRSRLIDENANEGLLDNYSGAGSQTISKKEQSPLFAPNENQQWAYGAPNMSEFYQSRVNPSNRMANVKPFEEEHVAPGLGLGYTTGGAGGFNSGMMMRDAWLDKTADQLRVDNKPKATGLSLFGHEGPANSHIKSIATQEQMGIMEKNRPETSFALDTRSLDGAFAAGGAAGSAEIGRLFTTGGAEKGPMMRAIPVERHVSRPEISQTYGGIAGASSSAAYIPGEYMPSHNQQLGEVPLMVANANGRNYATDADYGIKSKMAYPNNRSANKQDNYFGLVSGNLKAAIAPLLDVLRPSRKENVVGTLRPYQNPGTTVPQSYIFNPADRPAATIRETTAHSKNHLNVNANQLGGAYQNTEHKVAFTNRNETGDYYYAGNASAGEGNRQMTSYEANYNQRNNDIKASTIEGYMVQGNMNLMNGDINMRQVGRDNMMKNTRAVIGTMPYQSPEPTNMGRVAGNANGLYSNIQMDRNTPDITSMLQSNPYVVDYKKAL